jgi:predicted transcriptional regulator
VKNSAYYCAIININTNKKTKTMETRKTTFSYDKGMLAVFERAKIEFQRETLILLDGISWKVEGNSLIVTIEKEQNEQWLFHFGLVVGRNYSH